MNLRISLPRTYAKNVFHQALDSLPTRTRRQILYLRHHRRLPDFTHPISFSEKVNWRILNDRREVLRWTCDKAAMKQIVPTLSPSVNTPPSLWRGTDVTEIGRLSLPHRWVLKPNHLSGSVYIGTGEPQLDKLASISRKWLESSKQYLHNGEWAYQMAEPTILLEPWIGEHDSPDPPNDYKVFTFNGEPTVIQVHSGRTTGHEQFHYTPDWRRLDVRTAISAEYDISPPPNLPLMLSQAREIGQQFDFMRIDFYDSPAGLFFGEVTPSPAGGLRRFTPYSFDLWLGKHWQLPALAHHRPLST